MRSDYPIHPAAEIMPRMSVEQLQELADDIKLHGLREPIRLLNGQIIDGRHRLAACNIAKVEPVFVDVADTEVMDPVHYVVSLNVHRRHLKTGQRAMLAARLFAELQFCRDNKTEALQPCRQTIEEWAKQFSISPRYVAYARELLESGNVELIAAVERGEQHLNQAVEESRQVRTDAETVEVMSELRDLKARLAKGGEAFLQIRDRRLYREDFTSFEHFYKSDAEAQGREPWEYEFMMALAEQMRLESKHAVDGTW